MAESKGMTAHKHAAHHHKSSVLRWKRGSVSPTRQMLPMPLLPLPLGPLESSDSGNIQFSACWQLYTSRTNISLLILFGHKEAFPRGMGELMSLAEESSKKKDTNKCTDSLAWLLVSVAGFSEGPQWAQASVAQRMDNPFITAAKSLQSCLTLCDPIDSSPPGSPVPGSLQARTLEWVAISFSNAWTWKVKVKLLSCVQLLATPRTAAYQAPPSMGFSRQEYWGGVIHSLHHPLLAFLIFSSLNFSQFLTWVFWDLPSKVFAPK